MVVKVTKPGVKLPAVKKPAVKKSKVKLGVITETDMSQFERNY